MKKSSSVTLGLVASLALTFTACRSERQDCVDETNHLSDAQNCRDAEYNRNHGYVGYQPYRWVYGGSSGGHLGDVVFDGNPARGMDHISSGVSRGGFGSHGGGGGE
ncbi:MAG TPA: hypothetical protein VMU24_00755 [Candidatus Acidoferrales bacterium]|nr:hypothetical protein [Candidatus Acidoferrales bacterium]